MTLLEKFETTQKEGNGNIHTVLRSRWVKKVYIRKYLIIVVKGDGKREETYQKKTAVTSP